MQSILRIKQRRSISHGAVISNANNEASEILRCALHDKRHFFDFLNSFIETLIKGRHAERSRSISTASLNGLDEAVEMLRLRSA